MCGRFTLDPTIKFYERFKVSNRLDGLTARYNIAPSQDVPVIIRNSPNRIMESVQNMCQNRSQVTL
jgi:putative SOS response-associated peptidase YedK